MKRILGIVLLLAGIVFAVVVGVENANRDTHTTVRVSIPSESTVVYTAPGVLELVGTPVHVTLSAPGETIQWVLQPAPLVDTWVGDSSATVVTGLESWDSPSTQIIPGSDAANEADATLGETGNFDLSAGDLWGEAETADSTASFDYTRDGDIQEVLLATTSSGTAPELTLAWDRKLPSPNVVPLIGIGIIVALLGILALLSDMQDRDLKKKREARAERARTNALPLSEYDGDLVSAERDIQLTYTEAALGAAILPGTARAAEFRNRPLNPVNRLVIPETEPKNGSETQGDKVAVVADSAPAPGQGALILPESTTPARARADSVAETSESSDDTEATGENIATEQMTNVNWIADDTDTGSSEKTDTTVSGEESEIDNKDAVGDKSRNDWRSMWNHRWGSSNEQKGGE